MKDHRSTQPRPDRLRASHRVQRLISRVADVQEGYVARWQLIPQGVSDRMISLRIHSGFLRVVRPGVYSVGTPNRSRRGRCWAAVLAGGPGAVLGYRAAAALWGIREGFPDVVDVIIRTRRRPQPGIRWHREVLPSDEVTGELGIPVTTAIRTAFDLAGILQPAQTESAINELEAAQLWSSLSFDDLLERHPRRRGARVIRRILEAGRIGMGRTHEGLETGFLAFLDARGLPRPVTNTMVDVGGKTYECDSLWRPERVNLELDSRTFHETAAAFESDRRRDLAMQAGGWTVVRITHRALRDRPDEVEPT